MVATIADRRKRDAKANDDSMNPCVKCLLRMADDFGDGDFIGCKFVPEGDLTLNMTNEAGKPFNKCWYCLEKGENCFQTHPKYDGAKTKLVAAMKDFKNLPEAASGRERQKAAEKVRDRAGDLYGFTNDGNPALHTILKAHTGKDEFDQSEVVLEGRASRAVKRRGSNLEPSSPFKKGKKGVTSSPWTTEELLGRLKETEKALMEAKDTIDNQKAVIDFQKEQLRRGRARQAPGGQSSSP